MDRNVSSRFITSFEIILLKKDAVSNQWATKIAQWERPSNLRDTLKPSWQRIALI